MLLPLGPHDGSQHIIKLTKTETGVERETLIPVRFVPLLPGQAKTLTLCMILSENRFPLFGIMRFM